MPDKMEYSPKEEQLLKLLQARKSPVDTHQLCELIYGNKVPFHGRGQIVSAMRGLIRKVAFNREPFKIEKSERRGPHPIEFVLKRKGD